MILIQQIIWGQCLSLNDFQNISNFLKPENLYNLYNLVDHNINDEPHRANEESDTWKEVGRSRAMASMSKRYTHECQMGTDFAPQLSNRYNLLCNYSEDDNSPINALVSSIAKPRHAGSVRWIIRNEWWKRSKVRLWYLETVMPKAVFWLIYLFHLPSDLYIYRSSHSDT